MLQGTLKENQAKCLQQLEMRQMGVMVLFPRESPFAKDMNITDDQRKRFMQIVQEMQKRIEPLVKEAQSGGDPEEIRPKVMKIRKEHEDRMEAILTDAQRRQWNEMIGKPFAIHD